MAVKFVQKILKYDNPVEVLYYGTAIALVAVALTFFNLVSVKETQAKEHEKLVDDGSETRAEDLRKR